MTSCSILSRLSSFLSRLISSCLSLLLLLLLSPLAGSRGSGPPSSHHWLSTHLCGTASWAHELSPATPKTSSHFQNERSRWSYFKLTTKTTWICAPRSSRCGLTVSHMTVTVMLLPTTLLNEYCNTSISLHRVHSQWPTYSYIHVMLSSEKMCIADVNVFTCVTHKCFSWGTLRWKQMYFFQDKNYILLSCLHTKSSGTQTSSSCVHGLLKFAHSPPPSYCARSVSAQLYPVSHLRQFWGRKPRQSCWGFIG